MAYDINGVFTMVYNWATEAASPPIAISKLDTEMAGLATALSSCLLRNGTGKPTADIDWNAKKLTNLADATGATDALNRQTGDARYALASSGSFTATLASATSGGTTYATGTAYWSKTGNLVTLTLPAAFKAAALAGNNYAFVRGLPEAIRSACAIQQTVSVPIEDETTYLTGLLEIFTGSVDYMRLYTASGAYGFSGGVPGFYSGATFTYRVAD